MIRDSIQPLLCIVFIMIFLHLAIENYRQEGYGFYAMSLLNVGLGLANLILSLINITYSYVDRRLSDKH